MANVTWPYSIAMVMLDNYSPGITDNVLRTEFESGLIAQKRTAGRAMITREFTYIVKVSDWPVLRQWVIDNAANWFNFRDWEDKEQRDARVEGGANAFTPNLAADRLADGSRYYTGTVRVEGFL